MSYHMGPSTGTAHTGVGTGTEKPRLPRSFANHSFLYVHYPTSWTYTEKDGFLPHLGKIIRAAGCNGVDANYNMRGALGSAQQKGGTIIKIGDHRLGKYANYIMRHDTLMGPGRPHYCFMAETFSLLGNGRASTGDCTKQWGEFLAIVRDGILEPMADTTYSMLLKREERRLKRMVKAHGAGNVLKETLTAATKRLGKMKSAWSEYKKEHSSQPVGNASSGDAVKMEDFDTSKKKE